MGAETRAGAWHVMAGVAARRCAGAARCLGLVAATWCAIVAAEPATAQPLPPPGDGDIRAAYWELRKESEVWLTLEPRTAAGAPTPTLTFTVRFAGKRPAAPPATVEVTAFAGQFWAPRIEFWLQGDDGRRVDLRPPDTVTTLMSGPSSDYLSATMALPLLRGLAGSARVTGNALGFGFVLTDRQKAALDTFLERVRSGDPLRDPGARRQPDPGTIRDVTP